MTPSKSVQASLGRYLPLGDADRQRIDQLEQNPLSVTKSKVLWRRQQSLGELYILQSGWACTFRDTSDGERQVIELLLPGDIIGLREFTFRRHVTEARMLSPGTLCAFPHQRIVDLVEASTPLAISLFAAIGRQEALLTERMLITLHRSARSRILHFVLETYTRLNKVQSVDLRDLFFPISQRLLSEILGITPVHVNRTLMALQQDGVLRKHRDRIEVLDEFRLRSEADFDPQYLSDDVGALYEHLTSPSSA